MSNILISYELLEEEDELSSHQVFCNYLPFPFIISHFIFILTFILRIHRILQVCMMSNNEKTKAQEFYAKRNTLSEKYYLKIFLFGLIVICTIVGIGWMRSNSIRLPFYFQKCINDNSPLITSLDGLSVWMFFFENIALITYGYWILLHQLKPVQKIELFGQIALLILFPNISRLIYNGASDDYPFHRNAFIFLTFNYIFLSSMIYVPLLISLFDKVKTSYHFTPKLNSNLYLFLSDEICYYSFSDFMKHTETDSFYIALYTQIMKYKYKYTLEPDYYKVLDDAKELYKNYFEKEVKYISKEVMIKVKMSYEDKISKGDCTYEMFDDALVFIYDVLEKIFIEYRKSDEYFQLVDNLNLHSYALFKMCNSFAQQAYSL